MSLMLSFAGLRNLGESIKDRIPPIYFAEKLTHYLSEQTDEALERAMERVDYYHKINRRFPGWHAEMQELRTVSGAYSSEIKAFGRYFGLQSKMSYRPDALSGPGDCPAIVRSRPIHANNEKAVLFKFDTANMYPPIRDRAPFATKSPKAVWRGQQGVAGQDRLVENYYSSKYCEVGFTGDDRLAFRKAPLTARQQLQFKYILFQQGRDMTLALKTILSSNSICMMVEPLDETWLMEGSLRPGYHFVAVKSDFSNLEAVIDYYNDHTNAAEEIIHNANVYAQRFDDAENERLIGFLVLLKYLFLSGQVDPSERLKSFLLDGSD